jgi:hypothetical protein
LDDPLDLFENSGGMHDDLEASPAILWNLGGLYHPHLQGSLLRALVPQGTQLSLGLAPDLVVPVARKFLEQLFIWGVKLPRNSHGHICVSVVAVRIRRFPQYTPNGRGGKFPINLVPAECAYRIAVAAVRHPYDCIGAGLSQSRQRR